MVKFYPFQPLRPEVTHVAEVTSAAFEKPKEAEYPNIPPTPVYSFMQVLNPEMFSEGDLSGIQRYQKAGENLHLLINKGFVCRENEPAFYVYRQRSGGYEYTGIMGTVGLDDYLQEHVKKHELIHPDKANTLKHFFKSVGVNGSPVLLTYPEDQKLEGFFREIMQYPELYNFTSKDGVHHSVWRVTKQTDVTFVKDAFQHIPDLYIADGHHRCSAMAGLLDEGQYTENGTPNTFMAFCLPANRLNIFGFHRLLKHLNGWNLRELLEKIRTKFHVKPLKEARFPEKMGELILWIHDQYFALYPHAELLNTNSYKARLDVYLLENYLLGPFLSQSNENDPNIVYVEGTITMPRLQFKMEKEGFEAAFLLHPITKDFLMALADNGETLPPKSTWIEPKLRSGLFIHEIK